MLQILIIDNDKHIRRYYSAVLSHAGYHCRCAGTAAESLSVLKSTNVDLVILDTTLPDDDGLAFLQFLRDYRRELLILVTSARRLPSDIRKGFLAGADDYMAKPVDEDEMLLRIKALCRRARLVSDQTLSVGNTTLIYNSLTVRTGALEQVFPQKEFYLLYKLLSHPNQIFTRLQLLDDIWGPDTQSLETTVSVHINRLRKRCKGNSDFHIQTVRGLGYKACIHPAGRSKKADRSPLNFKNA